jgi:membrane protein involved in colicin uptake
VGEEVEKIIEQETVELDVKRKKRLEEDKAQAETKRKAEADERKLEQASESTLYKNDAERRAYAKEVISKVSLKVSDNETKQAVKPVKRYNNGVSDASLVKDMFG